MKEFCALRAKTHTYLIHDNTEHKRQRNKIKYNKTDTYV